MVVWNVNNYSQKSYSRHHQPQAGDDEDLVQSSVSGPRPSSPPAAPTDPDPEEPGLFCCQPAGGMEIAVGALSGMVEALPGKLAELVQQEYELLSGARGDVAFFQAELRTMHAAVLRCEALEDPDVQTSSWIAQVRDLAYDIEDWVDLFAHRVDAGTHDADTSHRFSRWIRRLTTIPDRHVIATELKELRARVVEVSELRKRYSLGPQMQSHHPAAVDPRLFALYADSAGLVGMDGPREEVAEMVTGAGSDGLKVVSIVGMAGSGKTTLAREVYRLVGAGFKCRALVSVGRSSDVAKVLGDMLSQVDGVYSRGRGDAGDVNQLIVRLRQHLQDKRYLVMIDDLWSVQTWGIIKHCFPENNLGSRIITTTRIEAVAKAAAGDNVYKTRLLDEANAETLFKQRTFGGVGGCPAHLKDVSTRIMRKCGGLPLAIVSVGGLLASKVRTRDEFERSGLEWRTNSELQEMKQIIKLSYSDLPANLKTCLLHLSIFPENHEIKIERLARRWIAEGFISEQRGTSIEETARNYISELIGRNLIQPSQMNHDGTHSSYVLHPVIHDFIICKSMEDNFVALVHAEQQDVPLPPGNGTVRRLSLLNSGKHDQAAAQIGGAKVSRARSITAFSHTGRTPRLNELSVLRVLDLEGCQGPLCLDGLCRLLLLRYLSLKGTDVCELPAQIGELRCLETLDVRSTKVKELPPSILRLEKLMHLLAGNAKLPSGINKMKLLLTLSCSNIGKSADANIIQELSEMVSLSELELFCNVTQAYGDKKQVAFPSGGFRSLKKLSIRCSLLSVTFVTDALSKVEVLELKFEEGHSEESGGLSGIQHLTGLKHMIVEFSQHDADAAAAAAAVKKTAEKVHPNCQVIIMSIDKKIDE
ncbi:disease resistance protein PIK6-NP-like [Hordeum vulgare subsp. vulgare]|uniref:AAA+ ATPase domain-containing protein n=1 Tax=Hordeum vulgare subsp. vulgare TaxID=112509 RepID=A0A8I6YS21_HORVV|nr:disease resistance protein PIK6-NP-like [Hordeum vulgare subsp. vulgare]